MISGSPQSSYYYLDVQANRGTETYAKILDVILDNDGAIVLDELKKLEVQRNELRDTIVLEALGIKVFRLALDLSVAEVPQDFLLGKRQER